jgi:ferric-dicitrate binding protein FerR (iron transport regulator)
MKKYSQYETNDFLQDESFINWVLNPEASGGQAWTKWMNANPEKKETAQKAIDIIRSFDFKKETVAENFYVDLKQRIDHSIAAAHPARAKVRTFTGRWIKAAAVMAGILIGAALLYYVRKPSYTYISTPYAAIKTAWLPDSTEVVLNANSSVRYSKSIGGIREALITGEVFFKVRHIENEGKALPFKVLAGNAEIEVLGTEFNVKSINHNTTVMLREGKVRFSIAGTRSETIMQPNDYCYYDAGQGKIITRVANPDLFTEWMDYKYRFENTTMKEVCETLEAYYGYDFIINNGNLDKQTFSGTLELKNEQVMMNVLGELFKTKITKEGNQIIVE